MKTRTLSKKSHLKQFLRGAFKFKDHAAPKAPERTSIILRRRLKKQAILNMGIAQGNAQADRRKKERASRGRIITPLHA